MILAKPTRKKLEMFTRAKVALTTKSAKSLRLKKIAKSKRTTQI